MNGRKDSVRSDRPDGPIFIVGVARSGTTLARSVLQASRQVAIAPESHFVSHVIGRAGMRFELRRFGRLRDDATIYAVADSIYSGTLQRRVGYQPYLNWLVKYVDRADFAARLLDSDRTEREVFRVMLDLYAERKGVPRAGEKTPAHLRSVDTLLEWFPNARIVHMVRDPRAIYVSELRRRSQHLGSPMYRRLVRYPAALSGFLLLKTTLLWADAADRDAVYRHRYPDRFWTQRFEDLVEDPQDALERLFPYLGLDLTEGALRPKVVSLGFNAGQDGFDAAAAGRWRESISPASTRWLTATLGTRMRRLGYEA